MVTSGSASPTGWSEYRRILPGGGGYAWRVGAVEGGIAAYTGLTPDLALAPGPVSGSVEVNGRYDYIFASVDEVSSSGGFLLGTIGFNDGSINGRGYYQSAVGRIFEDVFVVGRMTADGRFNGTFDYQGQISELTGLAGMNTTTGEATAVGAFQADDGSVVYGGGFIMSESGEISRE